METPINTLMLYTDIHTGLCVVVSYLVECSAVIPSDRMCARSSGEAGGSP